MWNGDPDNCFVAHIGSPVSIGIRGLVNRRGIWTSGRSNEAQLQNAIGELGFQYSDYYAHSVRSVCCSPDHAFCYRLPPNSPSLDLVRFFVPRVIYSARSNSCLIHSFRNITNFRGVIVTSSIYLYQPHAHGGLRRLKGAIKRRDEKCPSDSNHPSGNSLPFMHLSHI